MILRSPAQAGGRRSRVILRSVETGTDTSSRAPLLRHPANEPPIRGAKGRPGRGRRLSQMAKNFIIRTFGCQMNEHDSERLAGMLVADGMQQTDDMQQADVVVLNTCCIRENADQKLYGTLGSLKTLVDAKPGLQIAVGGCLAQKDRELIQQKVGWVDVVFGTHNLTSAPELLRRAEREGQVMEILDAPTPESISNHLMAPDAVRELPYVAWVNIQMGCDNSCAFCIVPSVRGPEVSRPAGRHRRRSGGVGAARGDRGDPVGAERQFVRPRHHPSPAVVRRSPARARRRRRHRPHPLYEPASEGSAARDDRGHGVGARGLRAAAPASAVGEQPRAGRHAPRATRPSGTSSGWPPPAPPSTISA